MFIRYLFLSLVLFSFALKAENPYLFQPNFSGKPTFIPQGTSVMPLCANPSNPLCFSQWTNQALPMANYLPSANFPQYNYFIPSFIPTGLAENPQEDEDWEEFYLPRSSYKRKRSRSSKRSSRSSKRESSKDKNLEKEETSVSNSKEEKLDEKETKDLKEQEPEVKRRFYRSKSNPDQVRIVDTNKEGEVTTQEGTIAFVNADDIKSVSQEKNNTPSSSSDVSDSDNETSSSKNVRDSKSSPTVSDTNNQTSSSKSVREANNTDSKQESSSETDNILQIIDESENKLSKTVFITSKDTQALPATTKEVKPGCFVINKKETQTEAGFCPECVRNGEDNTVLNSLIETQDFLDSINIYLTKVTQKARGKIGKQTIGDDSSVEKICSPEVSLKAIIDNFNKSCSPLKFDKFFKKANCKSCQKGIPVELMMAMMGIESAGRCPAKADNELETSAGLFQIDSRQHKCVDDTGQTYKINTRANLQCLKDPNNNLNKAIDVLLSQYRQVNSNPISKAQCKNWNKLKASERNSWRRAVSAYNGGAGWVSRAIKSARDKRTLDSTNYLIGSHSKIGSREKEDTASWEELRYFYFIEKLSPSNTGRAGRPECNRFTERDHGGTGRQLCLTVSNLAHTEAVLGREVKGSIGMVEIWAQYKRKFLKKHNPTCP